jgi:hypothetical protein
MRLQTLFPLILVASAALSCDQDPFGMSRRRLVGQYRLQQWEDERTYYVLGDSALGRGGDLAGSVVFIGWNDRFIVAERRAMAGGVLGWMLIDVQAKVVSGPLDSAALLARPALADIRLLSPDSAWRRLK